MFEINFIVVRFNLRSLCALKLFYKTITFILQKLNSIFNNKYIKRFSFILIELKFRLTIEYYFERRKLDRSMSNVIIYILY